MVCCSRRVTTLTTPDNAVVSTSYSGNTVTATEQIGRKRKSVSDGLGRLTQVYEDPTALNYLTSYSYDVLDNLTTVTQGVQTRTFVYDSLKRLTSASNPESGTVTYGYDNNGNLTSKLDARNISTTFVYDALNRVTSKSYNDNPQTPSVSYFYDAQSLPSGAPSFERGFATGRLVAVTYGSGASAGTYRGYDQMGRVVRQYQRTDSTNYLVEASYYANSSVQNVTYPSVPGAGDRRVVSYVNDSAGRLASLSSAATSYGPAATVSNIGYASHNALKTETYGNSLMHAITYNNRLQPNEIKLGTSGAPASIVDLVYNYGTTNNNGNVQSISYAGGGLSYTQTFGYDQLNRLTTSQEGASWSQTNGYDRYGNRWIDLGGGNQSLYFNTSNNRITGWSYDADGNLLNDGAHAYTFDGENKISKVDAVSAYVYDGEGQRVRKILGENLRFIYGIGGQTIAEFSGANGALTKEYIYGASGLVATIEPTALNANGTRYATSDHLGTPRVVTNSGAGVVSRHDYRPFGEELGAGIGGRTTAMGYSVADNVRQKFTQKERDNETGLDFFGARYYASTQGRFTGTDNPGFSKGTNPQTWNLYSYTSNNPLHRVDPDGHNWFELGGVWFWSKGDKYTYQDEKGKDQTITSNYTHLVLFEVTGTNDKGAATGTITIYNQDKIVAQEQGFYGGTTRDGRYHDPIPSGEYHINLTIPKAHAMESDIKPDGTLQGVYGKQEIPLDLGFSGPWGTRRVRLNELNSRTASQSAQGNYLHGHEGPDDVTLSCIGDRSQRTVDAVFEINAKQTPIVPVIVTPNRVPFLPVVNKP